MKKTLIKSAAKALLLSLLCVGSAGARTVYTPGYFDWGPFEPIEGANTLTHESSAEDFLAVVEKAAIKNPYLNALLYVFAADPAVNKPGIAQSALSSGIEALGEAEMRFAIANAHSSLKGAGADNRNFIRIVSTGSATNVNSDFNEDGTARHVSTGKIKASFTNRNMALESFQKAAELGSGAAMHFVALYYLSDGKGFSYGISFEENPSMNVSKENAAKAIEWLNKALESNEPTLDTFNPHEALARIYLLHPDFKDMEKARFHMDKAYEKSARRYITTWNYYPPKFSKNALYYAMYHEGAAPFEKDEKKAQEYFQAGLNEEDVGNFYAALAFAYDRFPAEYIPRNESKKMEFLEKALSYDAKPALDHMFYIYLNQGKTDKASEMLDKLNALYAKQHPDGENDSKRKGRDYWDLENKKRIIALVSAETKLGQNIPWEETLKILDNPEIQNHSTYASYAYAIWDSGIDTTPDPEKAEKIKARLINPYTSEADFYYRVAEIVKPHDNGLFGTPDILKGKKGRKELQLKYLKKASDTGSPGATLKFLIEELKSSKPDMEKVSALKEKFFAQLPPEDATPNTGIFGQSKLNDVINQLTSLEYDEQGKELIPALLPLFEEFHKRHATRCSRILCAIYEEGYIVEKNPARAAEIYAELKKEKLDSASDTSDSLGEHAYKIAEMFTFGRKFLKKEDKELYLKYLHIAADEGHGQALFELSCAYFGKKTDMGKNRWQKEFLKGLPLDPAKAKEYLIKAGKRGNFRACAVLYIAYKDGIAPFEKDEAKAKESLEKGRQPFKDSGIFTDFLKDKVYEAVADSYLYGISIIEPNLDKAEEYLNSLPQEIKDMGQIREDFAELAELKAKYWSERAKNKQ